MHTFNRRHIIITITIIIIIIIIDIIIDIIIRGTRFA